MSLRRRAGLLALVSATAACGSSRPDVTVPAPTVPAGDSPVAATPPPAAPGLVPPQPTLRLPKNFIPASYDARLAIDPGVTTFTGHVAISGAIRELSSGLWLHAEGLRITHAVARRGATEVALAATQHAPDLLELRAATPLATGDWTITLDYSATYEPVNTAGAFRQTVDGTPYVWTQFEATFARRAIPCVDEPDSKVPWKLTLDVPTADIAVANTPVATDTPLDAAHHRVVFATTKPLPTYLIAFGVGPFEIIPAGSSRRGTPIRIVTVKGKAPNAAFAVKTAARILDTAEDWFGSSYPYEKLDLLTIPITVGFGAMENAGLITFAEDAILVDPKTGSRARQHEWISTAAHEIAHQWFGDLVTPVYWDDIWLNEGFATWLATKIAFKFDPAYHDDLAILETRNTALADDALVSARQVREPIRTPDDISNVFDNITYLKGASILAMLERYVGPDVFQRGVREYLASKAYGNATSSDFIAAIASASGKDVTPAFDSFLDQPGAPELTLTPSCAASGNQLAITQHRYTPPGSAKGAATAPWHLPLCVAFEQRGKRAEACTLLDGPTGVLALPAGACPKWVMPNVEGAGYYRVAYTAAQIAALRGPAWPLLSSNERRAVVFDVAAGAETGTVPFTTALGFVPKLLTASDRFTVGAALEIPTGVNEWVSADLRGKYERYLRATFGPAALRAGFTTKPTDTLDTERTRSALLTAVAWVGRDPKLVAAAVALEPTWHDLPQSVRGTVLEIAVDAKPELFATILAQVHAEPDRDHRREMMHALASTRDVARQQQALALMLDKTLDIRETLWLPFSASTPENWDTARAFFRAHDAEILARLPSATATNPSAELSALFTATCRAEKRAEVVAYVTKTFGGMAGAAQTLAENTEQMDQCIARRALLEPTVRAWLSKLH